ncbi:MAG: hypothetical protein ABI595_01740 [Actinomycetota bacterium]
MATVDVRGRSTPMILGIVGGILLVVGTFLNWATATVNWDAIAAVIGKIPVEVRAQGTARITGWDIGPGKWMLVTGIVVVIASALLAISSSAQVVAFVMIFGGAVGGSMALYKATVGKDGMIDDAAGVLTGAPLPGSLRGYVFLSIGIGIWLCVLGGAVAVLAGIIAMVRRAPSISASTGVGESPSGSS